MDDLTRADSTEFKSFFSVDEHVFSTEHQNNWIDFAARCANTVQNLLAVKDADISLFELLQMLGLKRREFEHSQPARAGANADDFGRWRDGVYDQPIDQTQSIERRRAVLNRALVAAGYAPVQTDIDVKSSLTMYSDEHPLTQDILNNLNHCQEQADAGIQFTSATDRTTHQVVELFVRQSLGDTDVSRYQHATCEKYEIYEDAEHTACMTSFYILRCEPPTAFLVIEHPAPRQVSHSIFNDMNARFQALRNTTDKGRFIQGLADFIWYCHHMMPFERGSASITLILTASLLSHAGRPLIRYPFKRLDIDAMSLTKQTFAERFVGVYSEDVTEA